MRCNLKIIHVIYTMMGEEDEERVDPMNSIRTITCPLNGMKLRNSARYLTLYISCCGCLFHDSDYPYAFRFILRNTTITYLSAKQVSSFVVRVHSLVAHAWVWNPRPTLFSVIDHIDRDTQNNHASNLRFITFQLNRTNIECRKNFRKIVKRNGAVFYLARVATGEETEKKYCRTKQIAIDTTIKMREDKFDRIYKRHINEIPPGWPTKPPANMFYWRFEATPEGLAPNNYGARWDNESQRRGSVF